MKYICIFALFLLSGAVVYPVAAASLEIVRPTGSDIPFSDNPPSIVVHLEGAHLDIGAFSISIDGMTARLDADADGVDNDGDGLIDEASESPIRWPEENVSLLHGRWPWALQADDPLTPENEGVHTLHVMVISRPDIVLEDSVAFSIASTGGIDSLQVYPSPFDPHTDVLRIAYGLRTPGRIKIEVLDFYGSRISTIVPWDDRDAGWHDDKTILWDGKTDKGELVSNGVYMIRLSFKNQTTSNERIEKCFISY